MRPDRSDFYLKNKHDKQFYYLHQMRDFNIIIAGRRKKVSRAAISSVSYCTELFF
jgi:hypothetical protein